MICGDAAMPEPLALLAEDNAVNQTLFAAYLAREGYRPVCAGDGLIAVERWRAAPVALALMDLRMPRLDGLGAIREIRRLEGEMERPRTPIMMLSADTFPDTESAARAAGADMVASKPMDLAAFSAALATLMQGGVKAA